MKKTVKGYVSNILGKLHLAGRTQSAVYAWREGVVHRTNVGKERHHGTEGDCGQL